MTAVKEGCFAIGSSILNIAEAGTLARWLVSKDRAAESIPFLEFAGIEITKSEAGGLITGDQAQKLRDCVLRHIEAMEQSNKEVAEDALVELTVRTEALAFNKVVACELERK